MISLDKLIEMYRGNLDQDAIDNDVLYYIFMAHNYDEITAKGVLTKRPNFKNDEQREKWYNGEAIENNITKSPFDIVNMNKDDYIFEQQLSSEELNVLLGFAEELTLGIDDNADSLL